MEHDDEIQIDPVNYLRVIFCKEFQVSQVSQVFILLKI